MYFMISNMEPRQKKWKLCVSIFVSFLNWAPLFRKFGGSVRMFNFTPFPPRHTAAWRPQTRNSISKSARTFPTWEEFWVRSHKTIQGHLRVIPFSYTYTQLVTGSKWGSKCLKGKTKEEKAKGANSHELTRGRSSDLPGHLEHRWEGRGEKYVAAGPRLITRSFPSVTLGNLHFHLLDG